MNAHPKLVADIGGTNIRFGLVSARQAITDVIALRCADYSGPAEAALAYLKQCALPQGVLRQAAFAVASPVQGDTIKLTNSAWSFDRASVERALGIEKLRILNDFEALALSLPTLAANDYQAIGTARPTPALPMIVIGPGTGLGVAGVIPSSHGWMQCPVKEATPRWRLPTTSRRKYCAPHVANSAMSPPNVCCRESAFPSCCALSALCRAYQG